MTCDRDESKKDRGLREESSHVSEELKRLLSQTNDCYVLITCGKMSEDGKIQVEMSYEGDADLAAYLIESAQNFM